MHYVYEGCCGNATISRFCRLAEYEADPSFSCPQCGRALKQIITAPLFLNNTKPFEAFKSPVDGSIITCERSLREHNRRNNVVNIHEGYTEKDLMDFKNRDFCKSINEQMSAEIRSDAVAALQKVNQGYKPQVAREDSEL